MVNIGRKSLDIEINSKVFSIKFVSIYARRRAGELFVMIGKIAESDTNDLQEEELRDAITAREECLRNLLESNGYDYDDAWWEQNTGAEDQNEFIYTCLMKDLDKKKQPVKKV
jgi:hypothetical protein